MAIDIMDVIETGLVLRLVERGIMDKAAAEVLIGEWCAELCAGYGSDAYFIKRGFRQWSPALIKKIKKRYTGKNDLEIQQIYGMSRATFYRLIKN